jgi:hypothetical protein
MMSLGCFFLNPFPTLSVPHIPVSHWAVLAASLSESVSATRFTSHSHRNPFPAALLTNFIFSYDVTGLLLSFRICFSHSLYTSHSRRHWAATLTESVSVICTRHSWRHHWAVIFQNPFPAASQHCTAVSCSEFVFRRSLDFIFFVVTRLLFFQNPNPPLFWIHILMWRH